MTRGIWPAARGGIWLIRLGLAGAIALLALAATVSAVTASRPAAAARSGYDWVTSWSASPQDPVPGTLGTAGFHDQTVRDIIFPSVGGNMIRLQLTNAFGRSPLQIGRVTVAVAGPGAEVVAGNIHSVSFGGSVSVRIPAGEEVLSDPVGMQVTALQELTVSIYLPGRTGVATVHSDAQQVNWVSAAGDHAAEAEADAFMIPNPVLVLPQRSRRAVVRSGRDPGRIRRLDHGRRAVDRRRQRPVAERPGPETGHGPWSDALGGRRGDRRQPGA